MPSNQCTTSLTELSFAIGNMIGAQQCDTDDWKQIQAALSSWECSYRGKSKDAVDAMRGTAGNAIKACATADGCRAADCEDLFDNHEVLLQVLNLYDPTQLGRGYRGAIPPKIKGSDALERTGTLAEQRAAEVRRINARAAAELALKSSETELRVAAAAAAQAEKKRLADLAKLNPPTRHESPARGGYAMGYGDEERRERWYPARA